MNACVWEYDKAYKDLLTEAINAFDGGKNFQRDVLTTEHYCLMKQFCIS